MAKEVLQIMHLSFLDKELCRRLSQSAHAIIGHHVLVTDINGIVLGSDDPTRVGTLHEASRTVLSTGKYAYHDHNAANSLSGTRPGMTIPLRIDGRIVGTIGITGNPENISQYAMLIQQLAQTFFDFQAKQRSAQYDDYEKLSLLHDLTSENLSDHIDLIYERAYKLGFDFNLPRVVLRVEMTPNISEEQNTRNWLSRRVMEKMTQLFNDPQDFICVQNSTEIVAMPLFSESGTSLLTICEKAQRLIDAFSGECRVFHVGIGTIVNQLQEFIGSYQDANMILRVLHLRRIPYGYLTTGDIFLEKMALSLDDAVCEHVSSTLLDKIEKDEDREQLLEMITCWCHTHFNFAKTAEALHIHKSTLVYRFQRAKDKFQLNLYDFDTVMALFLVHLRNQLHIKN